MKKVITFVLAAIMCLGSFALAGCVNPNRPTKGVVRIGRWASEWEKQIFRDWTAEFEAENEDITIEWEFKAYTSHFDSLRTDLLSELAADIIFVNNWGWGPYAKIDIFEDLGSVESLADTMESIMPSARSRFKQGDKVIGVPIGLVTRVPVINADVWESADAEIPYNRDEAFTGTEFTNLMRSVGMEVNIGMGINVTITDALNMFLASAGAPLFDENGNIGCNTPAGIAAAQQFQNFMQSGWVVPYSQSGGGTYGDVSNTLVYGNTLAGWTNFGGLRNLTDYGINVATIAPFKAADATDMKDPEYAIQESKDVAVADFNTLVVPKFSINKPEAYRVIEWMLSKEQQLKYAGFADIPVNSEAFEVVSTNSTGDWDPMLYNSYKIGVNDLYVYPITPSEFSGFYSTQLKQLCEKSITPKVFCERMATDGVRYL